MSWSSTTNWIVSNGSLINSISFETPISSIEDSKNPNDQLVLTRPPYSSSDSETPCEITISFKQQHEIRQVYVRSSARTYEIYYTPEPQSTGEYLCTVRCGVTAKEDITVDANHTDGVIVAHLEESSEGPSELQTENIRNSSTDDDGWVKVKIPDSPLLDNNACTLATKFGGNMEKDIQDFYEATAEIADASPCISLKLRLLSLQTKGCVYLGEIYIYGELVESADSDDHVRTMQNSGGNALMATLLPSLLQFSRPGSSKIQDRRVSDIKEGLKSEIEERKEIKGSAEFTCFEVNEPVPDKKEDFEFANKEKESELSSSRIERILEQLVCRVGKIEELCLRFEANMLKPLTSIEARLERVEQQLVVLGTKSQSSNLWTLDSPKYTPDFPKYNFSESETNFLYNDDNADLELASNSTSSIKAPEILCNKPDMNLRVSNMVLDSSLRDIHFGESLTLRDDELVVEVAPHFSPCLKVTAPEFSIDDDGDNRNSIDASDPANKGISSSLDNALAMSLSKFLSSTPIQLPKIDENLTIEVHNSPGEDDSRCTSPAPRIPCEIPADFAENYRSENLENLNSTQCNFSQDNGVQEITLGNDAIQRYVEEIYDKFPEFLNLPLGQEPNDAAQIEAVTLTDLASGTEVQYPEGDKDGMDNIFKHRFTSIVDFELPVLDVEFVPQENWKARSSLEALLGDFLDVSGDLSHLCDMQESTIKCSCAEDENKGVFISEQSQLLQKDKEEMDNYRLWLTLSNPVTSEVLTSNEGGNFADGGVGFLAETHDSNTFAGIPATEILEDLYTCVTYPPCWNLEHFEEDRVEENRVLVNGVASQVEWSD
ncbi:hypothetical protein GIB67_040077 [Kingdonia uniflora]|uniref:Uncharacterized protein n=1 Tax=Kingdonia uniflora TaxID=39325 RepID=A0A7J7MUJ7_9MAGN|nr:hypothetical protein GIB67_040077 [Kingdonia uniflora]